MMLICRAAAFGCVAAVAGMFIFRKILMAKKLAVDSLLDQEPEPIASEERGYATAEESTVQKVVPEENHLPFFIEMNMA